MSNDSNSRSKYSVSTYVPASLSEIHDELMVMIGGAPKFLDTSGLFRDQNIDTEFNTLTKGFGIVRRKLGEERYAALIDLAARAKALFADDPDETNGKTMQGIKLIWEMMDIVQSTRKRRVAAKQIDDEGEVTGD